MRLSQLVTCALVTIVIIIMLKMLAKRLPSGPRNLINSI